MGLLPFFPSRLLRAGQEPSAPAQPLRVAVIHAAWETPEGIRRYSIVEMARQWRQAGHAVEHVFGPERHVPADIALLHVDLSVVPRAYRALARRYPAALNARVTDIRKRGYSRLRVRPGDGYEGPVIVKTNLNAAGCPEWRAAKSRPRCAWRFWQKPPAPREPSSQYPIYPTPGEVPRRCWKDRSLIIERFLPEQEGGFYFLRQAYFLGPRHRSWRLRGAVPLIKAETFLDDVEIPTPEAVLAFRRTIGLDYGKIDFVEHGGRITILDVNKTIGAPAPPVTTAYLAPAIAGFAPGRPHS
jgi:hypothetical protein